MDPKGRRKSTFWEKPEKPSALQPFLVVVVYLFTVIPNVFLT